jgi:hypothetical protein
MKCEKLKIMFGDEKDEGDKDFMIKINMFMVILVMMKAMMRKIIMSRKKMRMMWPMTNIGIMMMGIMMLMPKIG